MITNAALDYNPAQQRRDGYLEALKMANLPIDEALIQEGNYTPASGFEAMKSLLLLLPRPTAVFVASKVENA